MGHSRTYNIFRQVDNLWRRDLDYLNLAMVVCFKVRIGFHYCPSCLSKYFMLQKWFKKESSCQSKLLNHSVGSQGMLRTNSLFSLTKIMKNILSHPSCQNKFVTFGWFAIYVFCNYIKLLLYSYQDLFDLFIKSE